MATNNQAVHKQKRTVLSIGDKLKICKKLKEGTTPTLLAREYELGKSTISDIKRNKHKLKEYALKLDSTDGSNSRKTLKESSNKLLDEALYIWFAQKWSRGVPILGPILSSKALELNQRLNPSDAESFKASSGWLCRFKSRHGIRQLSIQGEKNEC